jgi:uncharacterized protein YbjT (DUF2867 family)
MATFVPAPTKATHSRKIVLIGATGSEGGAIRNYLLDHTDDQLTLFSRHADRLSLQAGREKAVSGSVLDRTTLTNVLKGQDAVVATLSGDLEAFAGSLVEVLDSLKQKDGIAPKLIFSTSMGIYGEVPVSMGGTGNGTVPPVLRPFRRAADVVEGSDLDWTILRPGWFVGGPVDYEITQKGEPFGGHDISMDAIGDAVLRATDDLATGNHESWGLNNR